MRKCIKSWKKYCPDYKIVEWNEKNFDIQGSCDYVREAYREQKWAFVSDYVRLWIIYNFGGIYLDTDVELIKNLDNFLENPAFLAYQDSKYIATGLGFGAEKGNKIIKCMLDDYKNCHFCINGEMDLTPCPVRNTNVIKNLLGTEIDAKKISNIKDAVLYPKEYFSQQEIDRVLTRGSGFEEGKYRINQMFSKNTTLKEKVQFLKKEYGEGGSSPAVGFINANYDAKGMSLSRYREIGKYVTDGF